MPLDRDEVESLSPEERKAYIDSLLGSQKSKKPMFSTGWPETTWHIVPGLLGLPVERDPRPLKHPIIILSMIATFVAIHLFVLEHGPEQLLLEYGFIPELWHRSFFVTLITSFFLHGGWMHLLGNAYYFFIFGDDVEDELHLTKFLFLLLGSHMFGFLVQAFMGEQGNIPIVGASAGISGLMGYYMVRFPKRQISYVTVFLFFYILWIHVPAYMSLLWKFGWELLIVGTTNSQLTNVAHWAHLGGALFGVIYALVNSKTPQKDANL